MKGRICLVTGANTGVGLETARGLAERGATVIVAARDRAKGEAAVEDLIASTGNDTVQLLDLDLASQSSIRAAAQTFLARHAQLDVLVNNAGLVLSERTTTEDRVETTFGVNHLGHFLLTRLLLEALIAAEAPRVVNVSSEGHRLSRDGLDFTDLQWERRPYQGVKVYCDSKLANVLFTLSLARRFGEQGLIAHAVHPGVVASRFARDGDDTSWFGLGAKLLRPFMISPRRGAKTSLLVATSAKAAEVNGRYWKGGRVHTASPRGRDLDAAKRLWEASERLVGLA
jgi:NAD(P)-dependent dehydrogenase (short-subunit alcohol dehydrogenase family)